MDRPSPEDFLDGKVTSNGRICLPVPRADDELTPVMLLLDEHLSTNEAAPPMRTMLGWPVEVQFSEPSGMHELTSAGANDEELTNSRLPPPKTYMLARHDSSSMAMLIEKYVRFFKEIKGKDGHKVASPNGCRLHSSQVIWRSKNPSSQGSAH